MDLRYGSTVLMTILSADNTLKAKLDTFTVGTTEYPMIFMQVCFRENLAKPYQVSPPNFTVSAGGRCRGFNRMYTVQR